MFQNTNNKDKYSNVKKQLREFEDDLFSDNKVPPKKEGSKENVTTNSDSSDISGKLLKACEENDLGTVSELLKVEGIDLNCYRKVRTQKMTFLYYSIEKEFIDVISLFLKNAKVDPNKGVFIDEVKGVKEKTGYITPLYKACELNNNEIIKMLLEHPKVDVNLGIQDPENIRSPLSKATEMKNIEVVQMFLSNSKILPNIGHTKWWGGEDGKFEFFRSDLLWANKKGFAEGFGLMVAHNRTKIKKNETSQFKGDCSLLYKEFCSNKAIFKKNYNKKLPKIKQFLERAKKKKR